MRRFNRSRGLVLFALGVGIAAIVNADPLAAPTPPTWEWTPSQPSDIVAYYIVELSVNEGPFEEMGVVDVGTRWSWGDIAYVNKYEIRVRAVSHSGQRGPYSPVSEPYSVPLPAQPPPGPN